MENAKQAAADRKRILNYEQKIGESPINPEAPEGERVFNTTRKKPK